MTADRFRPDNTEGYTLAQLQELNCRYAERCEEKLDPALDLADTEEIAKSIAEQVQREYDSE